MQYIRLLQINILFSSRFIKPLLFQKSTAKPASPLIGRRSQFAPVFLGGSRKQQADYKSNKKLLETVVDHDYEYIE